MGKSGRIIPSSRDFQFFNKKGDITLKKSKLPEKTEKSNIKIIEWILRIGLFGEFLGHGIFALQLKPRFLELLTAFTGITGTAANNVMYAIGTLDIIVAILALVFPFRLALTYAAAWGFLTAVARPVAGDPIWDFVERWANWAVPLALLYVRGLPKKWEEWFK